MADSNKTVYAAIGANAAIAIAKFIAAAFTGSSSMLAEGIHSLVDTTNSGLLLFGRYRSRREPDETHPFGYGLELYFWTLIVALVIFVLGGGVSLLQGIGRLLRPEPLEHPSWNYAVLLVAAIAEGYSCTVAYRHLRASRPEPSIIQAARKSKDPTDFTVLFEDLAALVGLAIAFLGVFLSHMLDNPYPDAIASILVGLVLAAVAIVLISESKKLLVGESADEEMLGSVRELVESDPAVARNGPLLTMQLGPQNVLLNLDVRFREGLSTEDIYDAIDRLETRIRQKHEVVRRIFLEIERPGPGDGRPPRSSGREPHEANGPQGRAPVEHAGHLHSAG